MTQVSAELLASYLDDALSDAETARVEQALRQSEPLRKHLRSLMQQRDRGEHSLGAIWRRARLTCPTRAQLGSYLLGALDPELQDYFEFHLQTIGCSYCLANLADLRALQMEPLGRAQARRRRFYESSAGFLHICQDPKKRP
jgi:hypothetical protein